MNVWKNSEFRRFFASFTISSLGDWFDIFALQIIFVHEWNASPIVLGVLVLLYFLPSIILSPIAGLLADRISQRSLMLYTDILASVFTANLFFSTNSIEALILIFIRSCIISFNIPAQQTYIKHVVPHEDLLKASSYTIIVFQMCKVLGPLLGATMLIYMPARLCLAINTLSFIISAILLSGLPKGGFEKTTDPKHWAKQIIHGAKHIRDTRILRITSIIVFVWFFCSLVRQTQMAIFLKHLFPNQENALGIFMGLDGLGAVVTSVILSRKSQIKNHGFYFLVGFLLLSLGILGVTTYQTDWLQYFLYIWAIITGCGTGILLVIYSYILKKETPKDIMGCVSAITIAFQNVALAMGTFCSGFLIVEFGIRKVYYGLAMTMLILGIFSLFFMHQNKKITRNV